MTTKDAQGAQTRCSQGGGAVQAANFKASRTCGPGVLLGWARAYVREESWQTNWNAAAEACSYGLFLGSDHHPTQYHNTGNTLRKQVYFRFLGSKHKLSAPSKVALSTRTPFWDAASHDTAKLKLRQKFNNYGTLVRATMVLEATQSSSHIGLGRESLSLQGCHEGFQGSTRKLNHHFISSW